MAFENYSRWFSAWMLLSMASAHSNQINCEDGASMANPQSPDLEFNQVVNVYYVMGFRPSHLYLYYTLLVPHTYASYIRH